MPADGSVEESWVKLQGLARRIGILNPSMKAAFDSKGVF
jgi:hypothetical protein